MIPFKRPILAASLLPSSVEHTDENILAAMKKLHYPVLATVKKDGIRALRLNGSLLSRTLKPIPNKSIRDRSLVFPGGFDMELFNDILKYDTIESIVMSREHPLSHLIQFHILDWFGSAPSYVERCYNIRCHLYNQTHNEGIFPTPDVCETPEQLMNMFLELEAAGHEGICFRTPTSPYKQGRSTLREQHLIKLCRFVREEVQIIGFEEQMCNANPESRNAVGSMDRSSAGANLIGKNTLGSLVCLRENGDTIRVGSGFSDAERQKIWDNQSSYLERYITIKHKPHGMKDKLRSPVFVGLRMEGF
jgi:DNA ligase-1